jgi:hypothetical protein
MRLPTPRQHGWLPAVILMLLATSRLDEAQSFRVGRRGSRSAFVGISMRWHPKPGGHAFMPRADQGTRCNAKVFGPDGIQYDYEYDSVTGQSTTVLSPVLSNDDKQKETRTTSYLNMIADSNNPLVRQRLLQEIARWYDTEHVAKLARLAAAFATTTSTPTSTGSMDSSANSTDYSPAHIGSLSSSESVLNIRDLDQVKILDLGYDHVDLQAVVREGEVCVTLRIPLAFAISCDPSHYGISDEDNHADGRPSLATAISECVLNQMEQLDQKASQLIAQREFTEENYEEIQATERQRQALLWGTDVLPTGVAAPVLTADIPLPTWWVDVSSSPPELQRECESMIKLLNDKDFISEIRALATKAITEEPGRYFASLTDDNEGALVVGNETMPVFVNDSSSPYVEDSVEVKKAADGDLQHDTSASVANSEHFVKSVVGEANGSEFAPGWVELPLPQPAGDSETVQKVNGTTGAGVEAFPDTSVTGVDENSRAVSTLNPADVNDVVEFEMPFAYNNSEAMRVLLPTACFQVSQIDSRQEEKYGSSNGTHSTSKVDDVKSHNSSVIADLVTAGTMAQGPEAATARSPLTGNTSTNQARKGRLPKGVTQTTQSVSSAPVLFDCAKEVKTEHSSQANPPLHAVVANFSTLLTKNISVADVHNNTESNSQVQEPLEMMGTMTSDTVGTPSVRDEHTFLDEHENAVDATIAEASLDLVSKEILSEKKPPSKREGDTKLATNFMSSSLNGSSTVAPKTDADLTKTEDGAKDSHGHPWTFESFADKETVDSLDKVTVLERADTLETISDKRGAEVLLTVDSNGAENSTSPREQAATQSRPQLGGNVTIDTLKRGAVDKDALNADRGDSETFIESELKALMNGFHAENGTCENQDFAVSGSVSLGVGTVHTGASASAVRMDGGGTRELLEIDDADEDIEETGFAAFGIPEAEDSDPSEVDEEVTFDDWDIKEAVVVSVGPAGVMVRALAERLVLFQTEPAEQRVINIPVSFPDRASAISVDQLRGAVLGLVDSVASFVH